jgi:hypothetical protein
MKEGWRKVVLAAGFGAAIAFIPMDEVRAEVLKVLILATMGANGLEHLAKRLPNGGAKNGDVPANRVRSVRPVTDGLQTVPGRAPGNDH